MNSDELTPFFRSRRESNPTTHPIDRTVGRHRSKGLLVGAASLPLLIGGIVTDAQATEPCGDFGECKVLIEINSSDGDIGFHWLADGDELKSTRIRDPKGKLVYTNRAFGPLREQTLTETFGESAEPLCFVPDPEDQEPDFDPDEVVTLEDFVERWADGTYRIRGWAKGGEKLRGKTELTYLLPAAPQALDFDGSTITWEYGTDLGNCTPENEEYPKGVRLLAATEIDVYEVVLEPEVDGPVGNQTFTVRVPGGVTAVTVPQEYLLSLGDGTPVKFEVGAIGGEDNATFTEKGDCMVSIGETATVECEEE
jgi:hypothetical protein